jgi:hypothetical protein
MKLVPSLSNWCVETVVIRNVLSDMYAVDSHLG